MIQKNYKETLNLPRTEFSMKANLSSREEQLIKKWEEMDLYGRMIKKNKGKKAYFLHDGPPYANGHLHIGHALNKTLKDVLIKYYHMKGFDAPYIPGWDCHGLPIELQVTQKLKNKEVSKNLIRKLCKEHAQKFVDIQKNEFQRLLVLGDYKNPYVTMSSNYEADILALLRESFTKGFVYRGFKPVSWCISCQTALAEAEIEYAPHVSPSIYVAFPLSENLSILIWTTTPWTLPSNQALAFHKGFEYIIAKEPSGEKEYIVALALLSHIEKETAIKLEKVRDISIDEIEKLNPRHPFLERESQIVFADHVTLTNGTGIVHTAPGHGVEDFAVAQKYGIPTLMPIDAAGRFTKEVPLFEGLSLMEANPLIIKELEQKHRLFYKGEIDHSYPHCWRCKNPLITRATGQFFINMEGGVLKEELSKAVNSEITYYPKEREKRMQAVIEQRPDWCISRQRIWGVPIPSLECSDCGHVFLDKDVLKSLEDMTRKEGLDAWFDEQKSVKDLFPFIKECPHCKAKVEHLKKGGDILDVWFDSGSSFFHIKSRLVKEGFHYEKADLYLEGSDQFRGWFQTSLILSEITKDMPPYKALLSHGYVLDEKGNAMSKSIGNVVSPLDVVKTYGADILRLWVIMQDFFQDIKVGDSLFKQTSEAYRKIRNTFRFMLSNLYDYDENVEKIDFKDVSQIDKWAIYKISQISKITHELYEKKDFHAIFKTLFHFMNTDLSSFYLDLLKDSLYTLGKRSLKRRSSQKALALIVKELAQLFAPILSFTCEEIYEHLPFIGHEREDSIFLTSFEAVDQKIIDAMHESYDKVEKLLPLREDVLKALEMARQEKRLGSNLQAQVILATGNNEKLSLFLKEMKPYLGYYFIVSDVIVDERNRSSFKELSMIEAQGEFYEGLFIYIYEAIGIKVPTLLETSYKYRY
jgi:isoleucyl-tRNA synthetase